MGENLDAKWNEIVKAVLSRLDRGIDVAFITIGDPGIYSTFFYLYDRLLEQKPSLAVEIIPGISSINAAAARAGLYLGLGNDRIAILPANYLDSLAGDAGEVRYRGFDEGEQGIRYGQGHACEDEPGGERCLYCADRDGR